MIKIFILFMGVLAIYLLSPSTEQVDIEKVSVSQIKSDRQIQVKDSNKITPVIIEPKGEVEQFRHLIEFTQGNSTNTYPELDRLEELEQGQLAPVEVLTEVLHLLNEEDPNVRQAVIEFVGEINHPHVKEFLIKALRDDYANVRVSAIESLAQRSDRPNPMIIEPYLYDKDKQVRLAAIRAIGEMESTQSVYALSGLLVDADQDIRLNAVNAMGEIGGEEASSYIRQLLYDPKPLIRQNAAEILALQIVK